MAIIVVQSILQNYKIENEHVIFKIIDYLRNVAIIFSASSQAVSKSLLITTFSKCF